MANSRLTEKEIKHPADAWMLALYWVVVAAGFLLGFFFWRV